MYRQDLAGWLVGCLGFMAYQLDSIQFPHKADVYKSLRVAYEFEATLPACVIRLTGMINEMGGKWPYSCCFMGCSFLDFSK